MVDWYYYPKNEKCPSHLMKIIEVFNQNFSRIDSNMYQDKSDVVLSHLRNDFEKLGYLVEKGKHKDEKIKVPVLYGKNGVYEKSFDADAYSFENKTVIEVAAGRAVANYQFLKDLFEACVMEDVDYLVISVKKCYLVNEKSNKDFETVSIFFDTLYSSKKFTLPLKGILIIGY